MKTIILSGGLGTRLSEKTDDIPKPMVQIAGKPMLWHIMQRYSHYGFNEFILALGYRQDVVKRYFLDFYAHNYDFSVDLHNKDIIHSRKNNVPPWKIDLIDTGLNTQTGGRVKRLKDYIGDKTFMLTYGDGLADINIERLVEFHKSHGKLATITAVHPPPRFGGMEIEGNMVTNFFEKPKKGWVNGGYFVLEPGVIEYIDSDETMWEKAPLERLAQDRELMSYKHEGFWQPMDTLRDFRYLQQQSVLNNQKPPPWLVFDKEKVMV